MSGMAAFYGRRETALQTLAKHCEALGLVRVTAEFSGGNDEGGVDGVTGTKADGTVIELHQIYWEERVWDSATRAYVTNTAQKPTGDADVINEIWSAMEYPVIDRWGSFAGEFSVSGRVEFVVADQSMTMSGSESVSHDESFESTW